MAFTYSDEAYDDIEPVIGDEADSGGYTVFEPGVYAFRIEEPVEKEKFPGSEKIPPCWKVTVKLVVNDEKQGSGTVFYNLFITKKQSWKIKQLFVGLELVDPNETEFRPQWNKVVGAMGIVKLRNREYNGNKYNEVVEIMTTEKGRAALAEKMQASQPTMNFPGM